MNYTRVCRTCYTHFETEHNWHTQCWSCWKRDNPNYRSNRSARRPRVEYIYKDRVEYRDRIIEVEKPMDQVLLKKLLMLCHPDKHNNSHISTEITQWLLNQKK